MIIKVSPSQISGSLQAPASKSSMQRACAAALLHKGTTRILNPGKSNDDLAAINIIRELGTVVESQHNKLIISSHGFSKNNILKTTTVHCCESGLSARMFTPIIALSASPVRITAEGSLLKRPMNFFPSLLPELNVRISSSGGLLPLEIQGPLQPKDISIDGSISSQYLTGLLFAFSAAAETAVTINVNNLKSKPYIDLTLDVMKRFGYDVERNGYESFTLKPRPAGAEKDIEYSVEGDWSNAAFLCVAATVAGAATISGIDMLSTQADKAIIDVLKNSGAAVEVNSGSISIKKADLSAFNFDATDCPDLFPPLAALAANCNGTSVIKGTSRLASKESDRAQTLKTVFETIGIDITLAADEMHITGGTIQGGTVSSHHDHRIAMAAAVAALTATESISIKDAEAVNKSYPDFFEDLKKLGGSTEIIEPYI